MFGIDSWELLVIAVVALVVIGPKDLPRVMRTIGNFVGRARGMAKHFRVGFDAMVREADLEDMEKLWQADNERIMREHPAKADAEAWPEPIAAEGPPAKAAPESSRPKAPPVRGKALPSGAAPPIPAAAPPGGDEGP